MSLEKKTWTMQVVGCAVTQAFRQSAPWIPMTLPFSGGVSLAGRRLARAPRSLPEAAERVVALALEVSTSLCSA